jgi:hypothetical protein
MSPPRPSGRGWWSRQGPAPTLGPCLFRGLRRLCGTAADGDSGPASELALLIAELGRLGLCDVPVRRRRSAAHPVRHLLTSVASAPTLPPGEVAGMLGDGGGPAAEAFWAFMVDSVLRLPVLPPRRRPPPFARRCPGQGPASGRSLARAALRAPRRWWPPPLASPFLA